MNKTIEEYVKEYNAFILDGIFYINTRTSGHNDRFVSADDPIRQTSIWIGAYFQEYGEDFIGLIESSQIKKASEIDKLLHGIYEE